MLPSCRFTLNLPVLRLSYSLYFLVLSVCNCLYSRTGQLNCQYCGLLIFLLLLGRDCRC
jgi:hypothetical protein